MNLIYNIEDASGEVIQGILSRYQPAGDRTVLYISLSLSLALHFECGCMVIVLNSLYSILLITQRCAPVKRRITAYSSSAALKNNINLA